MRTWRHLRAVILLPGVMAVLVPAAIVYLSGAVNIGWGLPRPWNLLPPLLGCVLAGVGLLLVYRTVLMFAAIGDGTLAPWEPTRRLVVRGVYRYVRNPMISGVCFVLLGESIVLGSSPILIYALIFLAINAAYIPLVEERSLARRFGEEYLSYKRNVPRWIPRQKSWARETDTDP